MKRNKISKPLLVPITLSTLAAFLGIIPKDAIGSLSEMVFTAPKHLEIPRVGNGGFHNGQGAPYT